MEVILKSILFGSGCSNKTAGVDEAEVKFVHRSYTSIVIEVNIVYSEVVGNPRTFHENLLREILGYYRGLGTLARVRGVVDSVKDVRPWHVAAAEKAVKALYMLM